MLACGQVINLGSVKITVLAPPSGMKAGDQNLYSLGLLVQYGSFRALLTGDSETAETTAWLRTYPASTLSPVDVYKAIHHGAANGDHPAWLAAVRPRNVVIGVGRNNYGHPVASVLALYQQAGASVYRTDLNGTVTVRVRPGGQYAVTTERGASPQRPVVPAPKPIPATPAAPPAAQDNVSATARRSGWRDRHHFGSAS